MRSRNHLNADRLRIAAGKKVKERTYWLKQLSGEPVKSSFPSRHEDVSPGETRPGRIDSRFPGKLSAGLMKLSTGSDIRLHVVLTAAITLLLGKYSGNDDIIVVTPVLKTDIDSEPINTLLILRNRLTPHMTCKELLLEVRQTIHQAYAHRNYPIEILTRELNLPDHTRADDSSLFEVALSVENIHDKQYLYQVNPRVIFSFLRTGEHIDLHLEYDPSLYDKPAMQRITAHLQHLMQQVVSNVDIKIANLDMLAEAEKKQLLVDFNNTKTGYSRDQTIHGLFAKQVEKSPDNAAIVAGQISGGTKGPAPWHLSMFLTYKELNKKTNQLAGKLRTHGTGVNTLVGILSGRSPEMVIGILAILKAGGAYLPLDPGYPTGRIKYMLEDCQTNVLLIQSPAIELEQATKRNRQCLFLNEFLNESSTYTGEPGNIGNINKPGDMAYVIYTSGSTGKAKGVVVGHRSVVRLVNHTHYVELTPQTRILQTGAPVFDASTFEIWGTLLNGGSLYLVDNEIILNAFQLRQTIKENKINTLWLSSPLFNQLLQQNDEIFPGLEYLLLGGDVLSPHYINRVRNKYKNLKVINGYGPTENTTFSTTFPIEKDYNDMIPIGKPISNSTAYILDRTGNLCPIHAWGELWVGGDGVSAGYLNAPGLTAENFCLRRPGGTLFEKTAPVKLLDSPCKNSPLHKSYFYRTGDLARWLPDGNIEISGRIDDQVKIRGYRVEPGEIERCLTNHRKIKEIVVLVKGKKEEKKGDGKDRYLCAYIVPQGQVSLQELKKYAAEKLPAYMIPAYFIQLDKLPLNPNGKVNRSALPEPQIKDASKDYIAPRNETEKKLAQIWSEVLGIEKNLIGINDNFLDLGGHSLRATKLAYYIHKTFQVNIEIKDIFVHPTIRELAEKIKKSETREYIEITPVEKRDYYEVSYAQRRLWIVCQFENESSAYNLPHAYSIRHLHPDVFAQAVQTAADRHEGSRTAFITIAGEPKQKIIPNFIFKLQHQDLREYDEETKIKKAKNLYTSFTNKPFDLESGPLFRVKLVHMENETHLLFFVIHHLVSDGWSNTVLVHELIMLYNSFLNNQEIPLPPIKLQYKDYTRWHNAQVHQGAFIQSRQYWLEKFKDKPNGIELPLDYPRKPRQTFNGQNIPFSIDKEVTLKLHRLCREQNTTLFMSILTVFDIFLHHYTGQKDIIVGSPIAGRKQPELQDMIGFLVNTLVYRTAIDQERSFEKLLQTVKKETLQVYRYQDYPFDLLVQELGLERDLSRSPLFNVMLAHNNAEARDKDMAMQGVVVNDYTHRDDFNMSLFDLVFFVVETGEELNGLVMYNTDLFKPAAINRMIKNFLHLLATLIEKKQAPLSTLSCMDEAEYETVLTTFNNTRCPFPSLTLQELFEQQVEKSGDKIALVSNDEKEKGSRGEGGHLSYKELNEKANQLAHYLRDECRVQPNDIIGVSLERSLTMIITLWGIIKAGAAYLAVDPYYPRERVLHVLSDSRSHRLIIDKMRPQLFAGYPGEILNIAQLGKRISRKSTRNPAVVNQPADILYVNYTSGSTGTPNGAMLSHDCLTNLIHWQNQNTSIDGSMSCLQFTSINFCVSFQEIAGTMTSGGKLVLIGEMERQAIDYLMDFLVRQQIELLFLPFSYLNFLFNESGRWQQNFKHNLKHIITAGEQLKITAGLKQFLDANPGLQLHNHYGSTEMHVVTSYTLDAASAAKTPIPPAGKPVGNVAIYILDDQLNPVPIGVWGELFVKGSSEILGYINNDTLTREKLLYHPRLSGDNIKLYRSGDIGRWQEDGNIELRGRKDFLVKIRGFRIEPGEIESKILSVPGVRECVVVVKEDENKQKFLVAYVAGAGIKEPVIREFLDEKLPQYMVPKIVVLDSLPLMPNGKLDRDHLPEPGLYLEKAFTPPANAIEEKLAGIWAELLEIKKDRIGREANFFTIGGHSLKATLMVARVYKAFDVKISLVRVFQNPGLAELAGIIANSKKTGFADIPAAELKEYYPLSYHQQRLFILHRLQPRSPAYNMPGYIELEHEVDKNRVEKVLNQLVHRHESLRTAFIIVADLPCQSVLKDTVIHLETLDISGMEPGENRQTAEQQYKQMAALPFDLGSAPLFRSTLLKLAPGHYRLLFNMHHIITDGWSMEILKDEFTRLYEGNRTGQPYEPAPLPVQYKDFTRWHHRQLTGPAGESALRYWKEKAAAGIPSLQLPVDSPAGDQTAERAGAAYTCIIPNPGKDNLENIAETYHTTLFTVMFSVYILLLSRISGQEQIGCSIIAAGRDHPTLHHLIGFFINPVFFSISVEETGSFENFLQNVHRQVIETFQHQSYPLERVFEEMHLPYPGIPVTFNMWNLPAPGAAGRLESLEPLHLENIQDVKFDIEPYITPYQNGIHMAWTYKKKLFTPSTIEYIVTRYVKMLEFFSAHPGQGLKDFKTEERKQTSRKFKRG